MKSLSEISINRPVFAWMLMAALIVFGLISFHQLGISMLPDVDFPVVSVSLKLPGAAPEIVESQVLDPIEDSIMQIDGIRNVTSTAQQSSGQIAVEFDVNRDIDEAMGEVQDRINQVQNLLPVGLFPPTLRKSNPEDQPILWLVLTNKDSKLPLQDLMIYARNNLYDQFSTVAGVGNIFLGGYVDPALRVWADLGRMTRYHLTSDDLLQAIRQEDLELPVGAVQNRDKSYHLRSMSEAASPAEFAQIGVLNRISEGPVYRAITLGDVATVEEGVTDVRKISRYNGVRAVGLGIVKQHGANAVEVANLVRKKLAQIRPTIPANYEIRIGSDNTRFIKQAVNELIFTLVLSALLTSLVCYLFLGSWTSTMNVLLAIPTSIIGTFIVFNLAGFTLNAFTLLGLALAVGIVVDDAIMMLENIVRHRELGQGPKEAALRGAKEITFAAVAATVAVVAIFLPVVFMRGIVGRYLLQYGITVTAAVVLSLLEALTLTPMRCSRYLHVDREARGRLARLMDRAFQRLTRIYEALLRRLLRHRGWVVLGAVGLLAVSVPLAFHLPAEFLPSQDQSMLLMRLKTPVGSSLELTNVKMVEIEKYLMARPEVSGIFSAVGGFGGDAVNQANAFVTLVDPKKRKLSQTQFGNEIRRELKKRVPGIEIVIQDLSLRGFSASRGFPVEFVVQGPDWNTLTAATNRVMDAMKKSGVVTDVNTDVQAGMPEVQLIPDRKKLAQHAVSLSTVTSVINSLFGGAILQGQTEYPKAGHRYEIELRLIARERNEVPDLDRVLIRNNRGETVPLSQLVTRRVGTSLMLISRLNRVRAITVYGNPAPGHSQQEALERTEKIARGILPAGYSLKMTGNSQSFLESFQSLLFALAIGILVSYMVLASQFNSFLHPITVLLALPFSFSGAFVGLWLFHQSINMYSLIGFILLMGIVKKNSILLVDFTNRARGAFQVNEALLHACPLRLRPILMTSVATIAGALPSALSIGPGAETRVPMAVSIIGGLVVSTLLTLLVVPCAYSLLSKLEGHKGFAQSLLPGDFREYPRVG